MGSEMNEDEDWTSAQEVASLRWKGGEPPMNNLEPRVARLESDVEYIKRDISEIKSDLKTMRSEEREDFKSIRSEFKWLIGLLITILVSALGGFATLYNMISAIPK